MSDQQQTTDTSSLTQAITAVTAELRSWTADKRNQQGNYDYISADAVLTRTGSEMAKHGLAVIPVISATDVETITFQGQNRTGTRFDAEVTFAMLIAVGPHTLELPWKGWGTDYTAPDKAVYKAITSGHKYFLMKLFCIGVGNEDGEHEDREPVKEQTRQQRKPRPESTRQRSQAPRPAPKADPIPVEGGVELLEAVAGIIHHPDMEIAPREAKMMEWAQGIQAQNGRRMSTAVAEGKKMSAYQFLAAKLDEHCGGGSHGLVLSALCGEAINKANPPAADVGHKLLDWLTGDDEKSLSAQDACKQIAGHCSLVAAEMNEDVDLDGLFDKEGE